MLQYRLKYEMVWTQMPFQNNNFLFNIFSLLSIFNSTFSLSLFSLFSLSPADVVSLFLLQITLPHPQINSDQAVDHRSSFWSPIKPSFHSTYAIVLRYDGLTDQRYAIVLRLYLAFSSPFHHVDLAITDLPIADLGFVGSCWWMWMWMWVCAGGGF